MILSLEEIRLSQIPLRPRSFRILFGDQLRTVFILDRYLPGVLESDGPAYHRLIGDWLSSGLSTEYDLEKWLEMKLFPTSIRWKRYERAGFQAEEWLRKGIQAATWNDVHRREAEAEEQSCPRVLYGMGDFIHAFHLVQLAPDGTSGRMVEHPPEFSRPWVAVFNSRKSRHVPPREPWLTALRLSLEHFSRENVGLAGSIGTLTYDLVTEWVRQESLPLLLVAPFALEDFASSRVWPLLSGEAVACTAVTCRTRSVTCARATCMVCRDRLLAVLADSHWILELRSGGNLLSILQRSQSQRPCPQWVMHPKRVGAHNEGNSQLLKAWPGWARAYAVDEPSALSRGSSSRSIDMPFSIVSGRGVEVPTNTIEGAEFRKIPWPAFLYHYTRACPGPWPGQSYQEYLSSLLIDDPLVAHTALDTLIRMLTEGLIRAGSKLVRGNEAVVSWTRVPPMEIDAIRHWNPALIRWTFEPYGIAISRKLLRAKGTKPTIYAGEAVYSQLHPEERYRFQRHEAPDRLWKHEREWRLRGDLALEEISELEGFVFVPRYTDARRLRDFVESSLPVVVTRASIKNEPLVD